MDHTLVNWPVDIARTSHGYMCGSRHVHTRGQGTPGYRARCLQLTRTSLSSQFKFYTSVKNIICHIQ